MTTIVLPQVQGRLTESAPLAPLVWFKSGGCADFLFEPKDIADLQSFLHDLNPATPVMALAMKTSEQGPDVAYFLASNPGESERIAALSPLEQAREMGRLEGRYAYQETPSVRRVTNAPNPPTDLTRGGGGKFQTSADTDDFAAFDKSFGN